MLVVRSVLFVSILSWMLCSPFASRAATSTQRHNERIGASLSALVEAVRLATASVQHASLVQGRTPDSVRTIEVTLSRFAFSPARIEVSVGERVRLKIVSTDGAHGFQVKALGLNVRVPAGGTVATLDLTPGTPGTYRINCSEYCGTGHGRMEAWLIVSPTT